MLNNQKVVKVLFDPGPMCYFSLVLVEILLYGWYYWL